MDEITLPRLVNDKKAIVFDLFHTLTALELTRGNDRPFTHQMLGIPKQAWEDQLQKFSRDRLIGKLADPVAIVASMARAVDPTISDEAIASATENRIARFAAALIQVPDQTQSVLRALKSKGKKIGLISNADVMEVAAWSRCPVADLFDSTVFSCSVGWAKPEAEIYEIALKELAVIPSEAIFVGDGGSDELQGARNVGMTAVMITGIIREIWPERIPERRQHADFVIERLAELFDDERV